MRDMTTGSPVRQILAFFAPLYVGTLFQQFYSLADSFLVGQLLGVNAFAAVGSTGTLNSLVLGFATSACAGFAIPISQSFGAGDMEAVRRRTGQTVWLSGIISLLVMAIALLFTEDFLRLTNTPADIFDDAYDYIFIILMGSVAVLLYNMAASILRALGDSRTPLYFLIVAVVLNVVLDWVFMVPIPLGVAGAALATVIAQLLSGLACLIYIRYKVPELQLQRRHLRPQWREMGRIAYVGIPMGLQVSIISLGFVFIQSATNMLGTAAVAAVSLSNRVIGIITAPIGCLGTAMATYAGQNLGAGRMDRIRQGVRQITVCSFFYCLFGLAFNYFLGEPVARLFVSDASAEVLHNVKLFLIINSLPLPVLTWVYILRSTIQGIGYSNEALLAGGAEVLARAGATFTLVEAFGFIGVAIAEPLAWVAADIVLIPLYFIKMRQTERRLRLLQHN